MKNPVGDYFVAQAAWRTIKAEEYPGDSRNEQSADALLSLAEFTAAHYKDRGYDLAVLAALARHVSPDGGELGGERAQREVSRYGFGYNATTEDHHQAFLEELLPVCLEDAYDFAADAGDGYDWTGVLYDFEVEAAFAGATLPHGYWRRPRDREQLEPVVRSCIEVDGLLEEQEAQ